MRQPPVAPLGQRQSLSELATEAIRQGIRDGGLVARQLYSEGEIGRLMGISRTPVRDAVAQLAQEGLIEVLPQRGFRLREISKRDMDEIFAVREALEGLVVEQLAATIEPRDIAALRAIIDSQAAVVDDARAFLALDERFHMTLPALAGTERVRRMLRTLRGEMWLAAMTALSVGGRPREVLAEHAEIVAALAAGDGQAARSALSRHLRATTAAIGSTPPT
jgi:DNA-binding GntR family transcriptional regulator